jgi:hypothetical protein
MRSRLYNIAQFRGGVVFITITKFREVGVCGPLFAMQLPPDLICNRADNFHCWPPAAAAAQPWRRLHRATLREQGLSFLVSSYPQGGNAFQLGQMRIGFSGGQKFEAPLIVQLNWSACHAEGRRFEPNPSANVFGQQRDR